MLEIGTIPFKDTFAKGFGHVNSIVIMDEIDTFDQLVLPIGVSLIEIVPDVVTRLSLDLQILFRLHDRRS